MQVSWHFCVTTLMLCICRAYTKEDWETHLLPLVQQAKYPELSSSALTLDLFRAAASWVASRAFGVDSYHGTLSLQTVVPC